MGQDPRVYLTKRFDRTKSEPPGPGAKQRAPGWPPPEIARVSWLRDPNPRGRAISTWNRSSRQHHRRYLGTISMMMINRVTAANAITSAIKT